MQEEGEQQGGSSGSDEEEREQQDAMALDLQRHIDGAQAAQAALDAPYDWAPDRTLSSALQAGTLAKDRWERKINCAK